MDKATRRQARGDRGTVPRIGVDDFQAIMSLLMALGAGFLMSAGAGVLLFIGQHDIALIAGFAIGVAVMWFSSGAFFDGLRRRRALVAEARRGRGHDRGHGRDRATSTAPTAAASRRPSTPRLVFFLAYIAAFALVAVYAFTIGPVQS